MEPTARHGRRPGLGLAVVQAVATAHGGTAHAENTGQGAVTLDLPCCPARPGLNGMERSHRGIVSGMNGPYLPWLGVPLEHGPWVAGLAMLAVTPGGLWMLALVLEQRLMGFRTGFVAVLVGDPLLALAVALGVWRMGTTPPAGPAGLWWGLVSGGGWLVFGLVQWRAELRSGFFTRQQAVAPTKIWHQLVVYPLLGYWLWTAGVGGLLAPGGRAVDVAGRVAIVMCVGGWALINGYDRRRPKLGHPPYDWRRLRSYPRPWPTSSLTLRTYLTDIAAEERADRC